MIDFIRKPVNKLSLAMRKPLYGVGINDAEYMTQPIDEEGKPTRCPHYITWKDMMKRCYSDKCQQTRPTYIGCSVDKSWHSFSSFLEWSEAQEWQGMYLDKDILVMGNKVYGPNTCCYVSRDVNNYFNDNGAARGNLPMGVSLHRGKLQAQLNIAGKVKYLGLFALSDLEAAVAAYKAEKLAYGYVLAEEITDERIRRAFLLQANAKFGQLLLEVA